MREDLFRKNMRQLTNRATGQPLAPFTREIPTVNTSRVNTYDDILLESGTAINHGNTFLKKPGVIQTNSNPYGSVPFQSGIGDCFEFEVDTTGCASPITLAILAGYFNTEKIELTETSVGINFQRYLGLADKIDAIPAAYDAERFAVKTPVEIANKSYSLAKYNCDPTEFNLYSGLGASVVLDDLNNYVIDNRNTISIRGTDSQFTCKNFREFVKYNPVRLNQFVIRGESLQNLNSTMKIGYCNSFQDLGSSKIKIDRFFNVNQYQDGQMTVVANQEIVLDKNKFWIWSIPAGQVFTFGIYI